MTKAITGQVHVGGLSEAAGFGSAQDIFGGTFWSPYDFRVSVLWWIAVTALGAWILARTRVGNWITAAGGDAGAARAVGVPVARVNVGLFVATLAAALVGVIVSVRLSSALASQGRPGVLLHHCRGSAALTDRVYRCFPWSGLIRAMRMSDGPRTGRTPGFPPPIASPCAKTATKPRPLAASP